MIEETEKSLRDELGRTRTLVDSMDEQIARLSAKGRRSASEATQLASLEDQKGRLEEGLKAVRIKLQKMTGKAS